MGKATQGDESLSDLEVTIYNHLQEMLQHNVVFYINAELIELCCKKFHTSEVEIYKTLYSLIQRKFIVPGTSLTKDKVMANSTRLQIFNIIKKVPGIHIRGICKDLNKRIGVILAHLEVLKSFGIVRSKKYSSFKHVLLFSSDFTENYDVFFLVTKNANASTILNLLYETELTLSDLTTHMGVHHSTIQYYLERLERLDLIIRLEINNTSKYSFNPLKKTAFQEFKRLNTEKIEKIRDEI